MSEEPQNNSMVQLVIVDDSQEDLDLIERLFRQCKILNPIKSLHSGEECISFLKQHYSTSLHLEPCLVFLDMVMAMSGVAVLRKVFSENLAPGTEFVMLSGITDIKAINEGYKNGARTFLIKPLKCEDIMDFLQTMKNRIKIEDSAAGYTLRWLPMGGTAGKAETETSFFKRSVSFST